MADETTLPGLVDAPQGGPPPAGFGGDNAGSGKSKPKNPGGRRSTADEVDAYLKKHGLVTVPQETTPAFPLGSMQDAVPVVAPEPFDEAGTRIGIEGLVNGADAVAQWQFERRAKEILKDATAAKKIGEAAAMPPPTRKLLVDSALEVCRKHGVNIGPEAGLVGALMQWGFQLKALFADLEKLAKPAEIPKATTNAPDARPA